MNVIVRIMLFCSMFVGAPSATAGAAEDSATVLRYLRELPCPHIIIVSPEQLEENKCPLEMRTPRVDHPEISIRKLYTINEGGVQLTVWSEGSSIASRYYGNADGVLLRWERPKGTPYDSTGDLSRAFYAQQLAKAAEHIRTMRR